MGFFDRFRKKREPGAPKKARDDCSRRASAPNQKTKLCIQLRVGDRLLDRYEIKEIRKGGFAEAYIAFDHVSEKLVTIETLRDEYMNNKDVVEGFLEQSRIMIKLTGCPT